MKTKATPLFMRVKMTMSAGPWVGIFAMLLLSVFYIMVKLLSLINPAEKIEKALDFPVEMYKYNRHLLDHSLTLPNAPNNKINHNK